MENSSRFAMTENKLQKIHGSDSNYKVYKIRWFMLLLFVFYSLSNASHWIQYSIITNIVVKYYGVTPSMVDWCSMSYMAAYTLLIIPGMWYINKKGLRKSIIIGSFMNMVGPLIKCGSDSPDRFFVAFIGQLFCASANIFVIGIPAHLAAVWFGPDQVSRACSIGVFGNQIGIALGFLLPPIMVPNSSEVEEVESGLRLMHYSFAAFNTIIFILILFFFKEAPETPPSQAAEASQEKMGYLEAISILFHDRNYVMLFITYGINIGVFYGISTLLNQTILTNFPGKTEEAGLLGLILVTTGMLGSLCCGFILDKTAKFKLVTLGLYVLSFAFMIFYTFIFRFFNMTLVFILGACLGFFMTGYLPVGFEFAAELTFPVSESISSGLLNASAQILSIIFIMIGSYVLQKYDDTSVNMLFSGLLLLGAIITVFIKEDLKRQTANKSESKMDIERAAKNQYSNNI